MPLASNALTTVAAVQAILPGLSSGDAEEAINAVSQSIERSLKRGLSFSTFTSEAPDYYQGTGSEWLILAHYPVVTVTQVKINDQVVTDFRSIAKKLQAGLLFRMAGWPRAVGGRSDLTGGHNPEWADFNIAVAYSGGYYTPGTPGPSGAVNLPADIERAARLAAADLVSRGQSSDVKSEKTPGGWSVEWKDNAGDYKLPRRILDTISTYENLAR